jgi:hypothetical protein
MTVSIPRGYGYREVTVQCGSTSHTGGVNQCDTCIERIGAMPEPHEDESDLDYFERTDEGSRPCACSPCSR